MLHIWRTGKSHEDVVAQQHCSFCTSYLCGLHDETCLKHTLLACRTITPRPHGSDILVSTRRCIMIEEHNGAAVDEYGLKKPPVNTFCSQCRLLWLGITATPLSVTSARPVVTHSRCRRDSKSTSCQPDDSCVATLLSWFCIRHLQQDRTVTRAAGAVESQLLPLS